MSKTATPQKPWDFLEEFRKTTPGKPSFAGTWPTLPEIVRISAHRFPTRQCFSVFDPETIELNFSQALEKIETLAQWIVSQGLVEGDRVAVTGKNSPEWAVAYFATLFAGCVVVPIDHGLHARETENLIKASGTKIVFTDSEKYEALDPAKLGLKARVSLEPGKSDYVFAIGNTARAPLPQRKENDLAAILYTSGTTGIPKGVMLTHANLMSDCFLAQTYMPLTHEDVFYALLPIHHSYTMLAVLIESMAVGAAVVFGKRLVTSQILSDLKRGKITMFLAVPLLFNRVLAGIMKNIKDRGMLTYGLVRFLMGLSGLIKKTTGSNPGKKIFHTVLSKASLDTIRICISGGGPLAPVTFKRFNQLGLDFVQGYGLTETSPILTLNPIWKYKEKSVGAILPQTEMKIVDPDSEGRGEIVVKGPMVMQGYYQNPADTEAVLSKDGWLHTGDVGWIDGDNYLYLTGRAKNLIVTEGGKNVYPEEIENEFQLYAEVEQVMVRGFIVDKATKSEGIEVLLYPAQDPFKDASGNVDKELAHARMVAIVGEVNARLHSYQKMTKITVLENAMEQTTKRTIRRHSVAGS